MTLRERLQPYFQTPTSFRLTAAQAKDELGSTDLANLITSYFPTSAQLQIDNCTTPSGDDPVLWDGSAKLIEIQASEFPIVHVKFATINDDVQAAITTSGLDSGWSFSSLAPALKDTTIDALRFDAPAFAFASNPNISSGVDGLVFSGTPRPDGPLLPFTWLYPDLSSMSLAGKVALVSGNAVMSLEAKDPNPVTLGPLTLTPELRVNAAYVPPGTTTLYVADANADATFSLDPKKPVTVSMALTTANPTVLALSLVTPISINSYNDLNSLAGGKVNFETAVPSEVPDTALKLDRLSLLVSADDLGYELVNIAAEVSLTPETPWSLLPNDALAIKSISVAFVVNDPVGSPNLEAAVNGLFSIGDTFDYIISVRIPQLTISGAMAPYSTIQVDQLISHFLAPIFGPISGLPSLTVYDLNFIADMRIGTFGFSAAIDSAWTVLDTSLVKIELTTIEAGVSYAPSDLSLFFSATWEFVFDPNQTDGTLEFSTLAAKPPGDNGWNLSITQAPDTALDLIVVLKHFLSDNPTLPPFVPTTFKVEKVFLAVNTKSGDYQIAGTAVAVWNLNFIPGQPPLQVMASLTLDSSTDPSALARPFAVRHYDPVLNAVRTTSGTFTGEVTVWDFKATVIYQFSKNNNVLTFQFEFRGVTIECTRTTEKDKQGQDNTILRGRLLGVTFGGMIEFLVNLVDPNLGFRLGSPWSVLNEISFDNLLLVINLTKKTIGFSYAIKKELGFLYLDTIGLTYVKKAGRSTVDINITGRFFDQEYNDGNPLSWDMLNDPPPTPPGKGDELLDLRYLGMGQNVGFRDTRTFDTVQSVIEALEADFLPVDSDQNPLLSPALDKLKFTGDGSWLIGADFTLIGAISLTAVFNDPTLYGLRIKLAGEKVKSFSGLDFQILYKKVTDTIGVYHIVLTLPDAFRQLQFGAVAITLPVVTVDIYTNGNFRIDMGFPVGLDFSKSFCVQAGVFIGYGGFYFAVLDGATSERVPKITNGNFSPVIEAGIALSVGLGRTFDKGVLSAGVSITLVTIIQGAFGWFNPNDRSAGTALYYWIQGTAAIVGKLYGKVNFVIIQADVNVTAYAQVTLTMESYKPILIELSLGVEVSVSLKILFFRITFSFSMTLDLSFTIGSASTPPWIVDASQPPPLMLRQQVAFHGRLRLSGARLQERLLPVLSSPGTFNWTPRAVFTSPQHVELSVVPTLTVALPDRVFATHANAPGATAQPQYQVVMSLFTQNSVPVTARRAKEVRAVSLPDAAATSFNLLVSGMIKWALSSYTRPVGVTLPPPSQYTLASDLEAISKYLANPQNWQDVFTYDSLAALMELNYVLDIRTPMGPSGLMHPNGLLRPGQVAPEVSAAIFPMIPDLEMGPKGLPEVQFWNYHCVDRDYENALAAYYSQLHAETGPQGANGSANARKQPARRFRQTPGPQGCTAGAESLSTFIFRDYFAMVTKAAVNSAIDLLKSYPYEPTGSTGMTGGSGPTGPAESLQSIANEFNGVTVEYRTRPGDTLGSIAGRYGIAPHKLQAANRHVGLYQHHERLPSGMALSINTGVTPAAIANENSDYPLHYAPLNPVRMTIRGVKHQVKSVDGGQSESLRNICSQYGVTGPTGPGSLFTFQAQTIPPSNPNANNTNLLQPGAQLKIPPQVFRVSSPVDDVPELVSAFFFVRSIGPAQPGQTPWYSYQQFYNQWIEDNSAASDPAWTVPVVEIQDGGLTVTGTGQYVPQGATGPALMEDTRELAAGYFAMTQLAPAPFTEAFQRFQSNVSRTGPPQTYSVAEFPYIVQQGDTMGAVAQLFGVGVDNLAQVNAGATGLMQPLAVVALPTLNYPIGNDDTFASVAANFDLTIDDLADSVEENPGVLQPYRPGLTPLNLPDLPGRAAPKLLDELVNLGRFNDVSGIVTRFLVHGMRVPKPGSESGATFPPDTELWGLYEMVGQQFPVPPGASGPSGQFNVKFTKGATANWICLNPPGPSAPSGPTGCQDDLVVYLNPSFFDEPPSRVLDPELVAGPGPLPLYRDTPKQYSLPENIHWQSATPIVLPGPTGSAHPQTGQPSIWTFPQTLLKVALQGPSGPTGSAPQYQLVTANAGDQTGASDVPVSHYCWAAAIDLRIQRTPSAAGGQYMPNSYVLLGADKEGRDQLLSAWTFLLKVQSPHGRLFILYSPSVTSDNSKGLASQSVDPVRTFLLKTNLTTVTQSNPSRATIAMASQPSGEFYARLEAIPDFLRLAWEASITGSGGFYLNYVNSNSGAGLPDTLFANDDIATITLLLLTAPQDRISRPDLGLYPFNNCAVVGDNIDPNSSRLYAEAVFGDLVRIASVPPGQAGFYLARTNPDSSGTGPIGPTLPADQTRNLYNLAGFQIAANNSFNESNQGLPIGPADTPVQGVSGPNGPAVWWYQQVLPVYKFGKTNNTPSSPALPSVLENPYAGITGPTGGSLSEVSIDLTFFDVYGNQTLSTAPSLSVTGPVGYVDDLIGVSSWPAAGTDFAFATGPSASVILDTRLSMQVDKYSPAGPYGFDQSSETATADAQRYSRIFYQVQQDDLIFDLQTNLGDAQITSDEVKAPITAFVSKAKVFADSCASQLQRHHTTQTNDRLGAIGGTYSVTPGMLVTENQNLQVQRLFQDRIVQPFFAVAGPMNTLGLLVANQPSTPYPPVCGPGGPPDCESTLGALGVCSIESPDSLPASPVPSAPGNSSPDLTETELLTNNQTAPLTPAIVLRTLARVDPLPANAPNTVAAVAAALSCVVYAWVQDPELGQPEAVHANLTDPGMIKIGLFVDNYTAPDVVAPNLDIEIDGVQVNTGLSPTLKSVEEGFSSLELEQADFVVKLENIPGIFASTALLTHADFIIPPPPPATSGAALPNFSIDNLPSGCGSIDFLATTNRLVPNFFYAGSAIYLRACCYQPQPFDTFASLAEQFNHITLDQLAQFNATARLTPGVPLAIPDLTYLESPASAYAPYSPTTIDSLTTIAGAFKTSALSIAQINQYLPGIFARDVTIPVGNSFRPGPLDSLQSAADALQLPFDQFVSAVASLPGLYRTNGVVITPLPNVPDSGSGKSPTLEDVAQKFNIQSPNETSVTPLLLANRSLEEFLLEGATIAGPAGSQPLTVKAHDTINTILARFQREQGLEVTVNQIISANALTPGLLTVNQPFLLPPSPTYISTAITPVIPPQGSVEEAAIIFPVSVSIELSRSQRLVAPDFKKAPAVFKNTSSFAPRGIASGASSVSLKTFAQQFEEAFASYRLKCALVQKEALSATPEPAQLYAVNFGSTGVSRLLVDASAPQFYALAPLSTKLLTGTLPIRPYKSGCGLGEIVYKQFDSVDLDSWMAQFLSTVDLFLTTPYAVPAFQLGGPTGPVLTDANARRVDGPRGLGRPSGGAGAVSLANSVRSVALNSTEATGCTGGTGSYGPGNYDDIVAAKYRLAEQLSLDVLPILEGVGGTGNYDNDVAQETLAQQMLVQLSDAYTVNAVVQYPVDVQSPCVTPISPTGATGPIPPRVSGKIVPDLYVTPQPTTVAGSDSGVALQDVEKYFGVSMPFLAETISGVHGLLEVGAKVTYGSENYSITQSDTINIVAGHLGVPTDPSQPGYWETWTAFVTAIASEPLLVAGGSLPVVKIARRVYEGDTIDTIAEFFGVDAATVGEANQSLQGIFEPVTLPLEGYQPYPIKPADTLLTIAAAINPDGSNPPLTVETLSDAASSIHGLLKPGLTLYLTQVLPDITLSTAKVSLGRVGSLNGLKPLLSFLFSVKHPRQYRKLFLNLKYVINEVEFDIRNVAGASGYQTSSWLTLVLPLGSKEGTDVGVRTDMAQVQIPIPLRSYPVPPSLVSQSGLPTAATRQLETPEEAIALGKQWDYRFDFQSANAAQDSNHVQVSFNPFSPTGLFSGGILQSRVDAVFGALAEFIDAYPQVIVDLARLPKLLPGTSDPTAAIAVMVLDTFATKVAGALGFVYSPSAVFGERWPELKYLYKLETTAVHDELAELQLVLESGPTGPQGGASPLWPDVLIRSLTAPTGGTGADAGFLPLTRFGPTAGMTASYKYPPGFPVTGSVTQRFLLAARDIIQNQSASGGIYLTRNDDLIASGPLGSHGTTGPTGPQGTISTSSAFLYQTPLVKFINPLTPFLGVGEPIDVAQLSGPSGPPPPRRKLAEHIENMLDAVLELGPQSQVKADSKFSVLCSYGFPTSGGSGSCELVATTPVRLVPAQLLTPAMKTEFAELLSYSITSWPGWPGAGGPGVLIFDLSVFTMPGPTGPSGPSESLKPILEFENMRVALADILPGETEPSGDN